MKDEEIVVKINEELEKIRPFLMMEGGNVEFVKYEDNIVYVSLSGACSHCSMIDITLKDGIEQLIINEIPEVKEVRKI
ncbi:MAG: NifU family protein [Bacilli bacterium]|nr:NifU family protein [Bacilli bacterium]